MNTYQDASLEALGDPTRRAILGRLRNSALAVGVLAPRFYVSRPAISQHLKVLKDARLVTDVAVGTRRLYQLDRRGFDSLREYLDAFWTEALSVFKQRAERRRPRTKR